MSADEPRRLKRGQNMKSLTIDAMARIEIILETAQRRICETRCLHPEPDFDGNQHATSHVAECQELRDLIRDAGKIL